MALAPTSAAISLSLAAHSICRNQCVTNMHAQFHLPRFQAAAHAYAQSVTQFMVIVHTWVPALTIKARGVYQ